MPLRVTLIHDDELTTRGVTSMLQEHPGRIELVRWARTLTKPIDVALYDHAVHRTTGRPTLAQLLCDARIRKVAVFTWNFQPRMAEDLIRQGAAAYLSKALTGPELVGALHAVSADRKLVSPATRFTRDDTCHRAERGEVLTEREAEILALISSGLSNSEIAEASNLSVNTVKCYIRTCYRKIEVDSRAKAVLWGVSHGLGDSPVRARFADSEGAALARR